MIAGTDFLLGEIGDVIPRFTKRMQRTRSDIGFLCQALGACQDRDAICLHNSEGMVVVTLKLSDDGKITAMVLLAVSTGLHGAFKRREAAMIAIAKNMGAHQLSFRTDRKGWAKVLGPEWTERNEVFSRPI